MSGVLSGIVKLNQIQYETLLKNKTITVNGIKVDYDQNSLYIVEKAKVTLDDDQEISGNKNFTGDVKKNNVDVATINDIPPVVDVLTSDSSTSSLSAKQGKVLNEKIQNMMSTLNGKNASFTFDTLDTLLNHFPGISKGDEPADKYLINTDKITYGGQEYTLKNGDIFLIVDINVPDYWFSIDDKTLYKLETAKVDLAEYAKITDLTMYAKTSDLAEYAKTSDISKDYLKKEDIADWAKQANPPSNVVLVDDVYQEIDGSKVFLNGITTGNGVRTTFSGFTDARRCVNDNSDTHQLSLYVEADGVTKLTHKNRSKNANAVDSYITFDSTKLKYGTSGNPGTAANNEYNIITSDYDAYKFALQEFNKSINLIDKNKYAIIEGSLGIDVDHLIIGETYTFISNKPIYWFKISDAASGYNSVSKDPSGSGFDRFTFTMSKNSNVNPGKRQYLFVSIDPNNVWTCPSSISELNGYEFQIEKGTKTHDINSYNGKIVWTGDKEYELWKDEYDKCINAMNPQSTSFTLSGAQVTYSKGDNYFTINGTTGTANISSTLMSFSGLSEATPYSVKFEYISGSVTSADSNYKDNIRVLISNSDYSSSFGINNNTTFDHGYVVPGSNGMIYVRLMTNLHKGGDVFNNYKFRIILTKDWREKNDMPKPYRYLGEIIHKKDLANVALSGSYSDLINKPTIVSTIDSSSNLPTSNAVKTFVESKSFNISSVKEDIVWDDFSGSWDGKSAITLSNFANYNAFDIFFYPAGPGGDGPNNYPVPICQRVWHPELTGDFFVLFGIRNGNIYERQVTYSAYGKLTVSNPKLNGSEKSGNTSYVRMVCIAGVKTTMLQ